MDRGRALELGVALQLGPARRSKNAAPLPGLPGPQLQSPTPFASEAPLESLIELRSNAASCHTPQLPASFLFAPSRSSVAKTSIGCTSFVSALSGCQQHRFSTSELAEVSQCSLGFFMNRPATSSTFSSPGGSRKQMASRWRMGSPPATPSLLRLLGKEVSSAGAA